jgi:ribosome-associated protein
MKTEQLQKLVIAALEEVKARDIEILDVRELTDMTDVMIVATGTSSQHVKSLASFVGAECKKNGVMPIGVEGDDVGDWVVVDLGDVLVHAMLPDARNFYGLEQLWSKSRVKPE